MENKDQTAVVVSPADEAQSFSSRVDTLAAKVMAVEVKDQPTLAIANEVLATYVMPLSKEIKARRKERIDAINLSKKLVEDDYKPAIEALDGQIDYLKTQIATYTIEQEEIAAKKQAEFNRIAAEKQKKIDDARAKAEAAGKEFEEPQIPEVAAELAEQVDTTLRATGGTSSVRKIPKVRILDESLIPRDYLVPDLVKINRDVKANIKVAGCELYYEPTVSVRGK